MKTNEIAFLDLEDVISIHDSRVEIYGGASGIRDLGLLKSALAMPTSGFAGELLHKDLFEMAAAYMFHIIKNHPFVDGNKRTGLATALAFLSMNGIDIIAGTDQLFDITVSTAESKTDKSMLADFFRNHAK